MNKNIQATTRLIITAKEVGEDVVPDLVQNALAMASKTSGAVIELVLSTAPTAANRTCRTSH